MVWIKTHKWKAVAIVLVVVVFAWVITHERQADLPYRVSGSELLKIKGDCKDLAIAEEKERNNTGIGVHELVGDGYSEYRGICYAEFITKLDPNSPLATYKVAYDTTDQKELFVRNWPKDVNWYESDFDRLVLGKSRILDFRQPF